MFPCEYMALLFRYTSYYYTDGITKHIHTNYTQIAMPTTLQTATFIIHMLYGNDSCLSCWSCYKR